MVSIIEKVKNGDIVYWCHRNGYDFSVHWGMVKNYCEHCSDYVVYIDYLEPKETRLINGIPIDDFKPDSRFKKLPKGWSHSTKLFEETYAPTETRLMNFNEPETIKALYNEGFLVEREQIYQGRVEAEITNEGWRLRKVSYAPYQIKPNSTSITRDRLYSTWKEAKKEVGDNIAELDRQANLTDMEWSIEQIDNTLNRWQVLYSISDIEKQKCRDWLLELENVEDVEVRLVNEGIQWKYWKNKRWVNIEL